MGFMPISDVEERAMVSPVVTIGLIAVNVLVFFLQPAIPPDAAGLADIPDFYRRYAVVPAVVAGGGNLASVFTAMFLHGNLLHLVGNMLYLWIFGDNVEDRLGHLPYLAFYLLSGVVATAVQVWLFPSSMVPNLGASGAIAGVLGAYLVLFPRAQINVLMGYYGMTRMSALVVLGLWFVLQLFSGGSQLGSAAAAETGGVAFWAHIGGFVAGAAMALLVRGRPARA
jgi:membrane associated rhomboid family serine protease